MHHLIIGAGPAGVVAAEHIRKLDKTCQITIVGDEPEPPYSRMAIPYFLVGDIAENGTYLRKQESAFSGSDISVKQARVESINTSDKIAQLNSGESLNYDKLLICTGSSPVRPPIDGMDLSQVYSCWTLDDARNIVALANKGSKVVLMGAGFIGCIVLEALAKRGVELTVIELENRMVPRMMNDTTGTMIKDWCVNKGVNVLTSTKVTAVSEKSISQATGGFLSRIQKMLFSKAEPPSDSNNSVNVQLDNGSTIEADLVICATGVKSNIAFLKDNQLKTEQGLLVDEYLQTSEADVYAAGDVAQGKDFSTGEFDVQAIQPTAVEHGKLAATNMVRGNSAKHRGSINMNVLDTLGLISTSFGLWMGVEGGESSELVDKANFKYLNLQFDGDMLVGASSLGMTQNMGVLRGMIQTGASLGIWKKRLMANPTRIMEAYLACAQSQSPS